MKAKLERLHALIEDVVVSEAFGDTIVKRRMVDADKLFKWIEGLLIVADDVDGNAFDLGTQQVGKGEIDVARKLLSAVAHTMAHASADIAGAGIACGHSGCIMRLIFSEAVKTLEVVDPQGAARMLTHGLMELLDDVIGGGEPDDEPAGGKKFH